jgi:hypothetical protein
VWVGARLGGVLASDLARAVVAWLDEVDPAASVFATPSDVLAIAAIAHAEGMNRVKRTRLGALARRQLQRLLSLYRPADDRAARWLRATGEAAVVGLIGARLGDLTRTWTGGLPREHWIELMPRELAPRAAPDTLTARFAEVASEPDAGKRKRRAAEAAATVAPTTAREAVELLVEARILRPVDSGGLAFTPHWVAREIAADEARDALREEQTGWGLWVFDEGRRRLLDGLLGELPTDEFERLVQRATESFRRDELGSIAAVEALFAAAARRMETSDKQLAVPLMRRLVALQLGSLEQRYPGQVPPGPLTRPSWGDVRRREEWVAGCWTWSFALPRPNGGLPVGSDWLFPNWSAPSFQEPPRWLAWLGIGADGELPLHERLLRHVPAILALCKEGSLPEDLPRLLVADAVILAFEKGWSLQDCHVQALRPEQVEQRFLTLVSVRSPEEQRRLARDLYRARVGGGGRLGAREGVLSPLQGKLRDFVFEHLPAEDLEAQLRAEAAPAGLLHRLLEVLPARLHPTVVDYALAERSEEIHALILDGPGSDVNVDALERIATRRPDLVTAVQFLWRLAPERAFARAKDAFETGGAAAQWFSQSPEPAWSRLLDLLEGRPVEELQPLHLWLLHRVLSSAPIAARAFLLLRRAGWRDGPSQTPG